MGDAVRFAESHKLTLHRNKPFWAPILQGTPKRCGQNSCLQWQARGDIDEAEYQRLRDLIDPGHHAVHAESSHYR